MIRPRDPLSRPLGWLLHLAVVGLGAVQAWSQRYVMNADGVAYLDIAQRLAGGDWGALLNGYWSPLYPALLGLGFRIAKPSPVGAVVLAHGLNFALYLAAYAGALWFAREVGRTQASDQECRELQRLRSPLWRRFGLTAVFLWCTVGLVPLAFVTPDLAGLLIVTVTAAALLRLTRGPAGRAACMAFGLLLGLGYLTRAALLVLAPVWLFAFWLGTRRRLPRVSLGWAAAGLVLAAGPFAVALSLTKGRPTIGDAGRLNYAWLVNGPRALGPIAGGHATPLTHPVRQLLTEPPVYEFAQPVPGTYPVWADPSYWQEGLPLHFDARAQWATLSRHLNRYGTILVPWLAAGVVLAVAAGLRGSTRRLAGNWALLTVCVAAALLYALVHVERRFIAPFAFVASIVFGFADGVPARVPAARFLVGLSLAGLVLFGACGPRNFVCGTGTTTLTMLLAAQLVLGAALVVQTLRNRASLVANLACLTGVLGLAALSPADPLVEPFVSALGACLLAALVVAAAARTSTPLAGVWLSRGVATWCLGLLVVPIIYVTTGSAAATLRGEAEPGWESVETARALQAEGLRAGDAVASIGNGFEAYWAHLAQVRIVAEVPQPAADRFWSSDSGGQAAALGAFAQAGARAVVADWPSSVPAPADWVRVDERHLLRWLESPVSESVGLPR